MGLNCPHIENAFFRGIESFGYEIFFNVLFLFNSSDQVVSGEAGIPVSY